MTIGVTKISILDVDGILVETNYLHIPGHGGVDAGSGGGEEDGRREWRCTARSGVKSVAVLSGGAFGRGEQDTAGANRVYRDCA